MIASPSTKRPGGAPTPAEPVSNRKPEENPVNQQRNTTAADRAARDAAVSRAMRDLEDDICSLVNMACILSELLNTSLVEYENGQRRQMPEKGKVLTVLLSYGQMEMLSFAWNDVINRAEKLKSGFNEACDAGRAA